tara:strand:- start:2314 stop:3156 length:843 start_codon:yes stop_codon:yes gene_type:complete
MDFTGRLNFTYPQIAEKDSPERKAFDFSRINRPTTIRDARSIFGLEAEASDATELLTDGIGFLLVKSESKVVDWRDTEEVSAKHYPECKIMAEALLPEAKILAIESHTFRDEDKKEHYFVDGIQYGPPALAVHNDYADSFSSDGTTITQSFAEIIGLPTNKRMIGLNIWRSVSSKPLERFPLAICDRTSIDLDDLEYKPNVNAPKPFNAHYCKPNDNQRWYYYSKMSREEALVFLTYDSHPPDGDLFRPTLHTAVQLPDSDGLQPRESIEVRIFAELPLP